MITRNIKSFKFTLIALFLFASQVLYAQTDTAAISGYLNRQKEKSFKNYAFLLVKDGKPVYKKEVGEITLKTAQPIRASSQWLTAALVMTFVQEGKISLDDKVSHYIPVFEKYKKGYITIRHCLTHYTGIQGEKPFQKNKFKTLEEEVNDIVSKKEILTNAGEESRYSNLGFSIAGRVLEIVSRKSFDRLFIDRVGRLSGMKNTTFANDDYNDAVNPATGAKASALDYANFLTMLLNKGMFNNKRVLSESSVETLLSLQVENSKIKNVPPLVQGYNYALGSWIMDIDEKGNPSAMTAPSYSGTFPVLDLCRKYAYVIVTKELSSPPNKNFYDNLKEAVDAGVKGPCK